MEEAREERSRREETEERFLDAAERLLVEVGYAGISTRRLAEEAGANHGLVHYYFGSMEELFLRVLERFTSRLIERQRALYDSDRPYLEKWREAMRYLDDDRESGYQKIWYELQAMAWNRPEMRARLAPVLAQWKSAMRDAVRAALRDYAVDAEPFTAEDWVTLIVTFNEGIILERLSGIDEGHRDLLAAIDRWLAARAGEEAEP
ncbi:MAG TPA: helix-turn-helix domain-containing protein [Longimicrobiales bacterium]|nr:helix-turn-helix domain-containing protein [Longimicrobiales bacterium]